MITAIVLRHPQSVNSLPKRMFKTALATATHIACGTSRVNDAHLSESNDFFPTYASWNSCLFETSVILTVWEHANELIGANDVAILHSDVTPHFTPAATWTKIDALLREQEARAIGLTVPISYMGMWDDWLVPNTIDLVPATDPMNLHVFDNEIKVWDFIRRYDADIHDWAFATQPTLIYSHQFACTRATFDQLGQRLYEIASKLRLRDVGFWTPHMFERLIALYLARIGGKPVLTTAFWHQASSGVFGPGAFSLYGPRPLRYYRVKQRALETTGPPHE